MEEWSGLRGARSCRGGIVVYRFLSVAMRPAWFGPLARCGRPGKPGPRSGREPGGQPAPAAADAHLRTSVRSSTASISRTSSATVLSQSPLPTETAWKRSSGSSVSGS